MRDNMMRVKVVCDCANYKQRQSNIEVSVSVKRNRKVNLRDLRYKDWRESCVKECKNRIYDVKNKISELEKELRSLERNHAWHLRDLQKRYEKISSLLAVTNRE